MLELFSSLSSMLGASAALALLSALLWGVCSVVFSPCHLAGIPLIIGFISETDTGERRRAVAISLSFAGGILLTLLFVGLLTGLAGRILGDTGPAAGIITGTFLLFFGVYLLEVLPFDLFNYSFTPLVRKKGAIAAFVVGLIFGLALGPCSFAFMAPLLGVSFSVAGKNLPLAVGLFAAYAIGHTAVIAGAGALTGVVKAYLAWNNRTGAVSYMKKACGVLVIAGGLYLFYTTLAG